MNHQFIYIIAAILLAGLGIYYFMFERDNNWWILLMGGAVFNMFLAWNSKKQRH